MGDGGTRPHNGADNQEAPLTEIEKITASLRRKGWTERQIEESIKAAEAQIGPLT